MKNTNKGKQEEIPFDPELPDPIAPSFLNRSLIDPWRRTDKLDCTETQIPANQIWTQLQQQMFELQDIARHRGTPNTTETPFTSPYPQ